MFKKYLSMSIAIDWYGYRMNSNAKLTFYVCDCVMNLRLLKDL